MEYRLTAEITVSAYTTVEADSLEQALKIAEDREAEIKEGSSDPSEYWLVEEIDGVPRNIRNET